MVTVWGTGTLTPPTITLWLATPLLLLLVAPAPPPAPPRAGGSEEEEEEEAAPAAPLSAVALERAAPRRATRGGSAPSGTKSTCA